MDEAYIPTPAEIAALCAEIQAGWSPEEHERRWTRGRRQPWQVPGLDRHGEVLERAAEQDFRTAK